MATGKPALTIDKKQQIYERHMNSASNFFSTKEIFNIEEFSQYMQGIYVQYKRERDEFLTDKNKMYVIRISNIPLYTNIDAHMYKDLNIIFIEKFPSIFKSDSRSKLKNLENPLNPLNYIHYDEVRQVFQLSNKYLNIITKNAYTKLKNTAKTGKLFDIRAYLKKSALNSKPHNKKRSCNNNTSTITQQNITMYNGLKKMYDTTDFVTIHTTIPNVGIIPTSVIRVASQSKNSWTEYGSYIYTLCIYHTKLEQSNIIIKHIESTIWGNIRTIEDCYQIHWLLAIACPFQRGSAGFAKVMLNAALLKIGFASVRETAEYQRKTDWVAIFSPTFEEYYEKVPQMFEADPNFQVQDSSATKPGGYRKKARCTRKKYKN